MKKTLYEQIDTKWFNYINEATEIFPGHKLLAVKRLTKNNNHSDAKLIVVKELGVDKFIDGFEKIKVKVDKLGYLPMDLSQKSFALYNEAMKYAKSKYKNYRDIHGSL